jgi:hypothetical protein
MAAALAEWIGTIVRKAVREALEDDCRPAPTTAPTKSAPDRLPPLMTMGRSQSTCRSLFERSPVCAIAASSNSALLCWGNLGLRVRTSRRS